MPRKIRARRFSALAFVSQSIIEAELPYFAREIENYRVLSPTDLQEKRSHNHDLARRNWEQIQLYLPSLNAHERSALQSILFRDLVHITALVMVYLKDKSPVASPRQPVSIITTTTEDKFNEWLFGS